MAADGGDNEVIYLGAATCLHGYKIPICFSYKHTYLHVAVAVRPPSFSSDRDTLFQDTGSVPRHPEVHLERGQRECAGHTWT